MSSLSQGGKLLAFVIKQNAGAFQIELSSARLPVPPSSALVVA